MVALERSTPLRGVILTDSCDDRFGVVARGDGLDALRHCDERVPSSAASMDDSAVVVVDPIAEEVLPEELPDILDRVQLWRVWRQVKQAETGWHPQLAAELVPSGTIDDQHGVRARGDLRADLLQGASSSRGYSPSAAPRRRRRCRHNCNADHAAPEAASRALPRRRSGCLAGRPWLHRPVHDADQVMAKITAERLVRPRQSGFVLMKRPPAPAPSV